MALCSRHATGSYPSQLAFMLLHSSLLSLSTSSWKLKFQFSAFGYLNARLDLKRHGFVPGNHPFRKCRLP